MYPSYNVVLCTRPFYNGHSVIVCLTARHADWRHQWPTMPSLKFMYIDYHRDLAIIMLGYDVTQWWGIPLRVAEDEGGIAFRD